MNEKKSGNPWPTRGSKRSDESAKEVRGLLPELFKFESSFFKEEGQSCRSSSDGFGIDCTAKETSGFRSTTVKLDGRFGVAKSSGFGAASRTGGHSSDGFESGIGAASRTGGLSSDGFESGIGTSAGFGTSARFRRSAFDPSGFGTSAFDAKKTSEFGVERTSAFGDIKCSAFGGRLGPLTLEVNTQKEETKAVKSEHLLSKDSGIGSYYAKADIKEFSEASESNSQLGIKKEPLSSESHVNHHNHNNNQRRRRTKNVRKTRYEKVCYHCQGSGHFSRFCPKKAMLGENGFGNGNANDSNVSKGLKTQQSANSRFDYFSAYRYNDEKNEREKSDDQLTKNLDAIFPVVTNDEDQKSLLNESFNNQKTQPKNGNTRVPINSLRSSSNVSASFQQPGPSPRTNANLNFDGFCISPLASPSKTLREAKFESDKESYQTIETRRTIKNPNGQECVEWTCIKFPSSLPPNVKVITAHMLPAQMFN